MNKNIIDNTGRGQRHENMDESIMQVPDETRREKTSGPSWYLARLTTVGEAVMKILVPVTFRPTIS